MQASSQTAAATRRIGWPERLLEAVGVAFFLVTLGATLTGVFVRYFHLHGMEWSFEVAGLSFVWVTFIGCVLAEMRSENVRFVGVLMMVSPRLRSLLELVVTLVLLGVASWLAFSGWAVLQRSGHVPTPVLRWPAGVMSASLFSAAVMLIIVALLRVYKNWVQPRQAS